MVLKLGLIGMSEGNGHPYSWAAICNGYSPEHMACCKFPSIPHYLANQTWPEARISGVEVTHIWTQDRVLSYSIAHAALIANVVDDPKEMIGQIDALLLARDDAEHHVGFARPFLEAGVPVYIDKPVALSMQALRRLYKHQCYEGQLFTCSALRYSRELVLSEADHRRIGNIKHIQAVTPNGWEKYSIHLIEPLLCLLGESTLPVRTTARAIGERGSGLAIDFAGGITADLAALGKMVASPIFIRVHGEANWCDLVFTDSFSAFKSALVDFIEGIQTRTCRSPYAFNERVVSIIEAGLQT